MSLSRSIILSFITLLTLVSLPSRAQEGELAAQDAKAQVNLRSLANTQAELVAMGRVGDRVQIISTMNSKDGQTWYRVKVLRTGQIGWVRGDLIKVFGASKASPSSKTAAKGDFRKNAAAATPAKLAASVPLSPPKSIKSLALPQRATGSAIAAAPIAPAKTSVAPVKPEENVSPAAAAVAVKAIAAPSVVIVSFQTPTYAVRIFSEAGQLRLNLFNRKSQQLALDSVAVESKNSGEKTVYSYGSDLKVTVAVPTKGTPTLTTIALGNTLQEEAETAPAAVNTAPK
jgi:Bacterial SH3 domain